MFVENLLLLSELFYCSRMAEARPSAPLLSTPATHIFEDDSFSQTPQDGQHRSDEWLSITYEIERTLAEIREGRWKRVALQFPDEMLPDAPRVSQLLRDGLKQASFNHTRQNNIPITEVASNLQKLDVAAEADPEARTYILGDTSYGSCCVDEIAAEHIGADVVVHYGRSCLSPTARLPVIYVFTQKPMDKSTIISSFLDTFPEKFQKVIITGDSSYNYRLKDVQDVLIHQGYHHTYVPNVLHNPSSPLPNRTVPPEVEMNPEKLKEWDFFHISDPPEALLLTLSSRVRRFYIYPVPDRPSQAPKPLLASTAQALRRRYALLTSVSTVSIYGILINTLSVKNYLYIVEHVKAQILAAGKKSYTFVVGKINAAKVANFSEIGAWVVVGCWESSLVESKDFWKPVLTPFELELALKGDDERVWTGEWRSNFQDILDAAETSRTNGSGQPESPENMDGAESAVSPGGQIDSEEESAPPEFDLRTGRYVSHSRPMQPSAAATNRASSNGVRTGEFGSALVKRAKGDVAIVGGEESPGAEYLRSKRTWKGLGSDFEIAYEEAGQPNGTPIEEGRSGIARGYVHGEATVKT